MSDSKKINYLNLDDKTIGGDTAVREISELTEIITEQNGLMQVKKNYDTLSNLLYTAEKVAIEPCHIANILSLINKQFSECIHRLEKLDNFCEATDD